MEDEITHGKLETRPLHKISAIFAESHPGLLRCTRKFYLFCPCRQVQGLQSGHYPSEVIFKCEVGQCPSIGGIDWFYPIFLTIEGLHFVPPCPAAARTQHPSHSFLTHPPADAYAHRQQVTAHFPLPPHRRQEDFLIFAQRPITPRK